MLRDLANSWARIPETDIATRVPELRRVDVPQVLDYFLDRQILNVGHNKAVAEIFGLRLSGFVAWLLWRGLYLLKIPTLARKTRLFLEWNWAMLFPPDISHFGYRRSGQSAAARQKKIDQAVNG